ncbi:SDR family oxidoreductase [Christiangramia forsetii]|uniref:Short-chain dehydrogenase/reductase family protein n=2 Tax=Christiangramia forsetii TaxID=411153 RepID=A0M5R9_CHRFK|nr:SDR family oxidoreductase [Christiangramia forsetii]GGG32345.1 oxidoreductase [Christiangramia forsetii]CAL67964.1 short-chain dehydrogenase/reductase family protein [Christiangramia forsetii KT0803]
MKKKVAVITGASSGIGKAIAEKLAEEKMIVVLASRNVEKLHEIQATLSSESMVLEMDVSSTESVTKGFSKIMEKYNRIDLLVNSAGIMPLTYLKNRHLDEWLSTIEVNVKGTLRCIYAALPGMKQRKDGHIVNIASVDGKEIFAGGAIYGASKAAVIELSRAMRMELSPEFNIRITAIEPGTVATSLREDITDEELLKDKNYGGNEAKLEPENIADAVFYAVSQPDSVNVNELLVKPTGKS